MSAHIAAELYGAGFKPEHFDPERMKPGLVIVEGVTAPAEVDGMKTTGAQQNMPVQFCFAHKVIAVAAAYPADAVQVKPGDTVAVVQAHLDPLDDKLKLAAIDAKHVRCVLKEAV